MSSLSCRFIEPLPCPPLVCFSFLSFSLCLLSFLCILFLCSPLPVHPCRWQRAFWPNTTGWRAHWSGWSGKCFDKKKKHCSLLVGNSPILISIDPQLLHAPLIFHLSLQLAPFRPLSWFCSLNNCIRVGLNAYFIMDKYSVEFGKIHFMIW